MKAALLTVATAAATLVACGATVTVSTGKGATATAVPATATATAVPPSPTAVPPPLAILVSTSGKATRSPETTVSAVDAGGHVQWTLTPSELDRLLTGSASDGVEAQAAGPNMLMSRRVGPYGAEVGHLVVIDRGGNQVGGGTFTQTGFEATLPVASPNGREWAWRIQDGATPTVHGRILVAGIGEATHSVFSWVAPAGPTFDEKVAAWTDMGIVLERLTNSGCGIGFHDDSASFLIDPIAGTLTGLFNGGDGYGDARHGVRVAFLRSSAGAVAVNGTAFEEQKSVSNFVQVSPDGATVGVRRFVFGEGGCGSEPTLNTELIDVATGTHTDIAGCGFNGWFDSTEFVCSPYHGDAQTLETVGGRALATLGNGVFAGAISG